MINTHPLWKGEKATYTSKHCWIHYHYGKADRCESDTCLNPNSKHFEWSNISGEYKRDISDWRRLCLSCHKRYDYEKKHGNKCLKGHILNKENTYLLRNKNRRCRVCRRIGGY